MEEQNNTIPPDIIQKKKRFNSGFANEISEVKLWAASFEKEKLQFFFS